ncbi:Copper amine oxidase N-terminal domain-containing protein [Peptoclostridium litorale DSM 5388]|uniref:GerMN domain-containing protein n=1 Tax=Peptoclostridium litorale DSM 5388 TaxID=1121324 RepID=A0A069RI12_PEPLI|nr:GerMN domain-containing protein [Peptoclostridium litorale]KDR96611.1 hypothetical protein CLIT_2c02170 [Peptoclostridium litorale DSM 5388]SIN68486.1 Copper amine oxidase N-terminal domain-containing protein [Peptoclostridium litorale DSM 5388]
MKKIGLYAFALSALLIFSFGIAYCEDNGETVTIYRNKAKIDVNGERLNADNFIYNGTTYVPLRAISEILGKSVGWNAFTNVASIDNKKYEKNQISKLLPQKTGYRWIYNGFAEYAHEMTLDSIKDEYQKMTYFIRGEVEDLSDGESKSDMGIDITYIISENSLIQEKTEKAMLDSKFDRITLIKTPLVAGTFWSEKLTDSSGKGTSINSIITKVEIDEDGLKQYTVRYEDINSSYYEERIIKEGAGVISVEKLLELEDSTFPVSYFLYLSGDVKRVDVKIYFPDKKAEKVHMEKRNIFIDDAKIAQGAMQTLMRGPIDDNLAGAIPIGTRLLDISISNGVCYVDFSREFIDNHSGGSASELMTLASIVNTLTEFDSVKKVQILVEGKKGETLGNILLDVPLERMDNLIGEQLASIEELSSHSQSLERLSEGCNC